MDEYLTGIGAGDGALVTDGEDLDLADLVAPELGTDGHVSGSREDVEDASTGGELSPAADNVRPGVPEFDEPFLHLTEVEFRPLDDADRFDVTESVHDRLHGRPGRRDHDPQSAVGELVEDLHPGGHGLRPRGEALMGQGLPGGKQCDDVTEHGGEFEGEVLRLPPGGGDDEDRGVPGEGGDGEGPGRLGPLDVEPGITDMGDQATEFRVPGQGAQDSGEGRGRGGTLGSAHGCPS